MTTNDFHMAVIHLHVRMVFPKDQKKAAQIVNGFFDRNNDEDAKSLIADQIFKKIITQEQKSREYVLVGFF